jgi:hypothetical protein
MKKMVVKVMALVMAAPVLLFAWGNDIVVDTFRRSENEFPICYDIMWPSDTNMIAAVGFNYNNTHSYVRLYKSTDGGQTWPNQAGINYPDHNIKNIQLEYYGDFGIILWLTSDGLLWFLTFNLEDLTFLSAFQIASADSVISAFVEKIERSGTPYFYIATTSRTSDNDILRIHRSIGLGAFVQVDSITMPNTNLYYTYKDLDAAVRGDSIKLYATFEVLERSTNNNDLKYWIFNDGPDSSFNYQATRTVEGEYGVNFRFPSLAVLSPGYLICLYETDSNIKYSFSNNYGFSLTTYDFPFNYADSMETTPFTEWWAFPPLARGFNTVFTRNGNLYFVESSCAGGGMSWGTPVLVSNEHLYSSYFLRDQNPYVPKLANRYDMSVPTVIWARDFSHYAYPTFFYDSTYLCVDNMNAVRINENNVASSGSLSFSVSGVSRGSIVLRFAQKTTDKLEGTIISTDGRVVKEFVINSGLENFSLDLKGLPGGIYFVNLKGKGMEGRKKFVLTR